MTFPDSGYLGVVTRRGSSDKVFYASLMRLSFDGEASQPTWMPHTLWEAMTDSRNHAQEMIRRAYTLLTDTTDSEL